LGREQMCLRHLLRNSGVDSASLRLYERSLAQIPWRAMVVVRQAPLRAAVRRATKKNHARLASVRSKDEAMKGTTDLLLMLGKCLEAPGFRGGGHCSTAEKAYKEKRLRFRKCISDVIYFMTALIYTEAGPRRLGSGHSMEMRLTSSKIGFLPRRASRRPECQWAGWAIQSGIQLELD
jgi:hypothetical protein